jgi:ribosomal protein S18 acetylase RimI-like enzyme
VELRRYRPEDAGAVVALLEATVGEGFAGQPAADPRLSWVADGGGLCAVALTVVDEAADLRRSYGDGPPFAGLGRLPDRGRIARIRQLAVHPRCRGRGLASALVAHVEAEAAELGVEHVLANAWVPSDVALPTSAGLFRRAGFEDIGEIPGFFRDYSRITGAHCPACGAPPCRCSVRVMLRPVALLERGRDRQLGP